MRRGNWVGPVGRSSINIAFSSLVVSRHLDELCIALLIICTSMTKIKKTDARHCEKHAEQEIARRQAIS
jgi:hypothetical protein